MFGARAPSPGKAMPGSRLHAHRLQTPWAGDQPAPTASRLIEPAHCPAPPVMPLHRLPDWQETTRARPRVIIVAAAHVAVVLAVLLSVPVRRIADGAAEPATVGVVFAAASTRLAQAPSAPPVPPAVAPEPALSQPVAPPDAAISDRRSTDAPAEAVATRKPVAQTANLPKVWTPSIQPTPYALPAAPQAAPSPAPAQVDPAWAEDVGNWLVQHRTAPTDARLRNLHGVVVIRFRVAPDGQVVGVWVLRGSGNRLLDQAALTLVRGTRVPPFPPDMGQAPQMVTLPIRYDLD